MSALTFVVGSTNQTKVGAVEEIGKPLGAQVIRMKTTSGVSDQPQTSEETLQGAINRAHSSLQSRHDADFGVGFEGGVQSLAGRLFLVDWAVLADRTGRQFITSGNMLPLPPEVESSVRSGTELSVAMGEYTGKQPRQIGEDEGTVGVLTNGAIKRQDVYNLMMQILWGQYIAATAKEKTHALA